MAHSLVVSIRLHDGRYHGSGDWPPAPARLFQALVAGAGLSGPLENRDREALEWLERLPAPIIGAPRKSQGHSISFYVPNNDLDSVGGDPSRIAEIRGSRKLFKPRLFDSAVPFIYAWTFGNTEEDETKAATVIALAERVYQFGRGIDFAYAWGEILTDVELRELLSTYVGRIHRPSGHGQMVVLSCPTHGSLKSLEDRYRASGLRFRRMQIGRGSVQVFTKVPRSRFAPIAYDSQAWDYIFELRNRQDDTRFIAWPLVQITRLVELLRDRALSRLCSSLPSRRAEIETVFLGRGADRANGGVSADRVRILPLPSIGHHYVDREIRRLLIRVPPNCPLLAGDVAWAFSGIVLSDSKADGAGEVIVSPTLEQTAMPGHYGIANGSVHRVWRTVTPAALPIEAARRRIDPKRMHDEAKSGWERVQECTRAATAVVQALRHAEVSIGVRRIRVQREPFEAKGQRAEAFAEGTRFSKHQVWHIEIEFTEGISGPVIIGNGRFLGLGIMAPVPDFYVDPPEQMSSQLADLAFE